MDLLVVGGVAGGVAAVRAAPAVIADDLTVGGAALAVGAATGGVGQVLDVAELPGLAEGLARVELDRRRHRHLRGDGLGLRGVAGVLADGRDALALGLAAGGGEVAGAGDLRLLGLLAGE